MLFGRLLRSFLKQGELTVVDADGKSHRFGDPLRGPSVTIRLHDRSLHRRLFFNPRLAVGEAYMDGTLTVENGTVYDLLDLLGLNTGTGSLNALDRWVTRARMLWQRRRTDNVPGRSRRNVAHHYDLSGGIYDLFLDADRQYTCAYHPSPDVTLEQAQQAKKTHIAAKLLLEPGQRILDMGCGWGGLSLYLAEIADVEVVGVTLSEEQHKLANQRARDRGLHDRVRFELCDYRAVEGTFDRIAAIGILEHVGTPHYRAFFENIGRLLTDDGVALMHTISHMDEPYPTNPWLDKYIFPGGYCPALSELVPAIERANLWITDIEILRLHYAQTLRHWRERFMANWDEAARIYDERFCRMWEFYLAGCEMVFRRQGHMNAQIQVAKSVDTVPLTRDYMVDWERRHAEARRSGARAPLKSVG